MPGPSGIDNPHGLKMESMQTGTVSPGFLGICRDPGKPGRAGSSSWLRRSEVDRRDVNPHSAFPLLHANESSTAPR